MRDMRSIWSGLAGAILALAVAGCQAPVASGPAAEPVAAAPVAEPGAAAPAPVAGGSISGTYRLGSGDQVRLIVFGEDNLGGEFLVDGSGMVSLPLIGSLSAKNLTLRELENAIATKLREGYLNDPRVSVEVLNYRPFSILGEVNNGGEYPYRDGMSVLNAVAAAGGYTYRADTRRVLIRRADSSGEVEYQANQSVPVMPGDIIRIPERFF